MLCIFWTILTHSTVCLFFFYKNRQSVFMYISIVIIQIYIFYCYFLFLKEINLHVYIQKYSCMQITYVLSIWFYPFNVSFICTYNLVVLQKSVLFLRVLQVSHVNIKFVHATIKLKYYSSRRQTPINESINVFYILFRMVQEKGESYRRSTRTETSSKDNCQV